MSKRKIKITVYTLVSLIWATLALLAGGLFAHVMALKFGPSAKGRYLWDYTARTFYIHFARNLIQNSPDCVEFDDEILYKPKNGSCVFNNYEFKTVITSVDGHRVNNYTKESPELVILGDSYAQGWGVNDNDTAASVLTRDYKINALTFGMSSYGTAREMVALRRFLASTPKKAKYVYIMYCGNDSQENFAYMTSRMEKPTLEKYAKLFANPQRPDWMTDLSQGWRYHLESIRGGFNLWNRFALHGLEYGEVHSSYPREIRDQVLLFKDVLSSNLDILNESEIIVSGFNGWGSTDKFAKALARNPLLYNGKRITVIPANLPPKAYYPLDGHMNPLGHQILAQLVANAVTTLSNKSNNLN